MANRVQDIHQRGTRANQPAASAVANGTIYHVTDEGVTERSNATSWESYSGSGDHGGLSGLTDDDHSQYPLVTTFEADRATIASRWDDLTDGGDTSLHTHAGGGYDATLTTGVSEFVDASDTTQAWEYEKGLHDFIFKRKTADETVNGSDTLQNDDDFFFAVGATEVWEIELVIALQTETARDWKFSFTGPTSVVFHNFHIAGLPVAAAGNVVDNVTTRHQALLGQASGFSGPGGGGINAASVGSAGYGTQFIKALAITSSTSGTINFQWAQLSSGASDTIVKAGSYMIARRVG